MNELIKDWEFSRIPTTQDEVETFNISIKNGHWPYSKLWQMTPVFRDVHFPKHFGEGHDGLIFDKWHQIDPTETILLPGSIIRVQEVMKDRVVRMITSEYHSRTPIYTHASFIDEISRLPLPDRIKQLPSRVRMIHSMRHQEGKRYIWWGNSPMGVPELLDIFRNTRAESRELAMLKWFDCSGLLYWATNGNTPRNTSELIDFGRAMDIEDRSVEEIIDLMEPLDIVAWKWHCLIVLDRWEIIESSVNWWDEWNFSNPNGVRIRSLQEFLTELMHGKNPRYPTNIYPWKYLTNQAFVVRRWW
jgi:hypothetical protein